MRRLVGVYAAEGSLLGELRYVVGKLMGTRSCSLCDVTHGKVRKKASFVELEQQLATQHELEIEMLHLDELEAGKQRELGQRFAPCVLEADGEGSWRVLVGKIELDELGGSVERFEQLLQNKLAVAEP